MIWLVKGFWAWADLTGAIGPGLHLLKTAFDTSLAMALIFAILDLIAAVTAAFEHPLSAANSENVTSTNVSDLAFS